MNKISIDDRILGMYHTQIWLLIRLSTELKLWFNIEKTIKYAKHKYKTTKYVYRAIHLNDYTNKYIGKFWILGYDVYIQLKAR